MFMKQNKYLKIGLFVTVALIWGSVFFKITKMKDGDAKSYSAPVSDPFSNRRDFKGSHELLLNYKDPFLKNGTETKVFPKKESGQDVFGNNGDDLQLEELEKEANKEEKSLNDLMGKIKYYGFIGTDKQKGDVGFIGFESDFFVLQEGELFNNITIEAIKSDSLIVKYDSKSFVIPVLYGKDEKDFLD